MLADLERCGTPRADKCPVALVVRGFANAKHLTMRATLGAKKSAPFALNTRRRFVVVLRRQLAGIGIVAQQRRDFIVEIDHEA